MEIVKYKEYKGNEDYGYFNVAHRSNIELEEIDITNIIRKLK
jgi:hypothetical protein